MMETPAQPSKSVDDDRVALCVDLDGTLVRTDLLVESALAAIKTRFLATIAAISSLFRGKARLKRSLAELVDLRLDLLPYNPRVLSLVRSAREADRPVILVTASDAKYAQGVVAHLGLFDGLHASDGEMNLSSSTKADLLVGRFGEGGFDYVGDSLKDLEVWRHARNAIAVDPGLGVVRELKRAGIEPQVLLSRQSLLQSVWRALRPHQWLKNLLVFLPLLTAHRFDDPDSILASAAAFVGFSLMASAGYLVNDLLDLDADRAHPRKRNRPFASGELPVSVGLSLIPLLVLCGILIGAPAGALCVAVLLVYLVSTLAYSLYLKRKPTVDALTLAGLYTLRVIAGTVVIGTGVSFWLLAFSMFLFLGLAYVKRYAELYAVKLAGGDSASGRGYNASDLPLIQSFGVASGFGSVLVLALYINSPEIRELYSRPDLVWLICPLLLYWTARIWMIAHRGQMHDDPLVFAIEDRISQLTVLASALVAGLAI